MAVLGIDIQPDDPPVGRHPFEAIRRLAVGPEKGAFGVIERAGNRLAYMRQNTIERPAAPVLGQGRKREREHQQGNEPPRAHVSLDTPRHMNPP
jgi:hypothetical protein